MRTHTEIIKAVEEIDKEVRRTGGDSTFWLLMSMLMIVVELLNDIRSRQ